MNNTILLNLAIGPVLSKFESKTKPRFQKYAEIHNLNHTIITSLDAGFKRSAMWFKIYKILEQLYLGNTVWYLDADVSILDFDAFPKTEKDIGICKDSANILNSGVMFIKPTEFSKTFLTNMCNRTDCDAHVWQDNYALLLEYDKLTEQEKQNHFDILDNRFNVTIVKGEIPYFDQYLSNECVDKPWFRHFAGGQHWHDKYFNNI